MSAVPVRLPANTALAIAWLLLGCACGLAAVASGFSRNAEVTVGPAAADALAALVSDATPWLAAALVVDAVPAVNKESRLRQAALTDAS